MQNLDLKGLSRVDLEALAVERAYSQSRWYADFDSKNTLNDWVTYICMYATESAKIMLLNRPDRVYKKLIKAANLALLAAEHVRTGERGRRHYDPPMELLKGKEPQPDDEAYNLRKGLDERETERIRLELMGRYRGITNDEPPVLRPGGDGIPVDSNGGPKKCKGQFET